MTYQDIEALPLYFILAKGRSGTTLLQTMIDAHPNTVAPTESRFLIHFHNKYRKTKSWTEKRKKNFFEDVVNEQKIALFWNLDIDKLKVYLDMIPENASYATVCKAVYLSFKSIFAKDQPICIVDKNPVYSWLIPIILDTVPNAKFIHLIRDPRACVNSTINFRTKSVKSVARSWSTDNNYIEKFKALQPKNFLTVYYEDVIMYPKRSMKDISRFLKVEFSENMLHFHEQVQKSIDEFLLEGGSDEANKIRKIGFEKIHKNLVKPLDPTRIDNWKAKLSQINIKQTEDITRKLLVQYGYEHSMKIEEGNPIYYSKLFTIYKTQLYYLLPIWLRELKSKPKLVFLENENV